MIFTYAIAPYEDWHQQAWAAGFVLLIWCLTVNIIARWMLAEEQARRQVIHASSHSTTLLRINAPPQRVNAPPTTRPSPVRSGPSKLQRHGSEFLLRHVSSAARTSRWRFIANHVTAFIGPSGCGKSTFLRTLNRMNETVRNSRVEGEILLDGENIFEQEVSDVRRRVGMVFQRSNPFPEVDFRQRRLWSAHQRHWQTARRCAKRWSKACAAPRCGTKSRTS